MGDEEVDDVDDLGGVFGFCLFYLCCEVFEWVLY